MIILLLFSFLAGIATVLSPCVLPILPAILSGGLNKGTLRPLGVILGLVASFSFFTLALTALVKATGIDPSLIRWIAIGAIALFGLVMIFPALSALFARLTSFAANAGQQLSENSSTQQTGFGGGLLLGIALGLLWTPCAGPILASVTSLALTGHVTIQAVLLTLAYSLGSGIPLLLIAYGGNRLVNSTKALAPHSERIRQIFGALMIATAIALAFNVDRQLQVITLQYLPSLQPDTASVVRQALKQLAPAAVSPLQQYGAAPEFAGLTGWVNSQPLTLASLKGKVVLVDFWTYSCINCIRTLPYVTKWYDMYKDKGFVVIGVHTPEFEFEKNHDNVAAAVARFGIKYPVPQDNTYGTWTAYQNQYWPADYLIDKQGIIRDEHFGEGDYDQTEQKIVTLLNEGTASPAASIVPLATPPAFTHRDITQETYLGYTRGDSYTQSESIVHDQPTAYVYSPPLGFDEVGISGTWTVTGEKITCNSSDCSLDLNFNATHAYLVLSGSSTTPMTITLDGKPQPSQVVNQDRLYTLVDLPEFGRHVLGIHVPPGVSAHAFTFGE